MMTESPNQTEKLTVREPRNEDDSVETSSAARPDTKHAEAAASETDKTVVDKVTRIEDVTVTKTTESHNFSTQCIKTADVSEVFVQTRPITGTPVDKEHELEVIENERELCNESKGQTEIPHTENDKRVDASEKVLQDDESVFTQNGRNNSTSQMASSASISNHFSTGHTSLTLSKASDSQRVMTSQSTDPAYFVVSRGACSVSTVAPENSTNFVSSKSTVVVTSKPTDSASIMTPRSTSSVSELTSKTIESATVSQITVSVSDVTSKTSDPVGSVASQGISSVVGMTSLRTDSVSVVTSPQISPRSSVSSTSEVGVTKRQDTLPGKKKRKRRGSAWSDEQTEFLMEIWARHTDHNDNKEGVEFNHNAPVYRIIAKAMEETGNPKTWEQCKTRIHTLKRAYKLTRDEIRSGATNITYCRHFDKLEIIMGDNETTTPQMLAAMLELRRKHKQDSVRETQAPQKRKQLSSNKSAKRANIEGNNSNPAQSHQASNILQQNLTKPGEVASNDYWSQLRYDQQTQEAQQTSHQQQEHLGPNQYSVGTRLFQPPTLPPPPPYPVMTTSAVSRSPGPRIPEINNNDIVVKQERQDNASTQELTMSTMTSQTWSTSQPPQKEELEKMRLDLELRKIEMERNKLEMEERQRREERDHQYRMLQLLLFGLGQQNSAQFLSGQGAEQVVAQAQNSTNLSRALENGLVPGGPHCANEKGLSFNEI